VEFPKRCVEAFPWLEVCHWVFRRLEVCQRGEPLYGLEVQYFQ